jgi:quinol monooxygenase YgiN
MHKLGLYMKLEAKPGKEDLVAAFLASALPMVEKETGTTAWFAIRTGPSTFAIFDTFRDEKGREAHMTGRVADALKMKASELLVGMPSIDRIDVIAGKLPH